MKKEAFGKVQKAGARPIPCFTNVPAPSHTSPSITSLEILEEK